MALDLKDNKGNTYNIGLINNVMQNNTDFNINFKQQLEFDGNIINHIIDRWELRKIKKYYLTKLELESERTKCIKEIGEQKLLQIKYVCDFEQRFNSIQEEYKTNPRVSIIEPTINLLEYNIGEEQIREMFTNLLLSEMDTRKKQRVSPAFIHIIQELSMDDAKFIKMLKDSQDTNFNICNIRWCINNIDDNEGFAYREKILIIHDRVNNNVNEIIIDETILDNLQRLNIITIINKHYLQELKDDIGIAFENYCKNNDSENIEPIPSILEITKLGQNFIDICCS